mmetsp:Transcript_36482/g.27047  ORF Transcript_36482/g.27047 Transcript_36482/m.27047 type:complete len:166 (-) Transcript_36482:27-524(-)|eukprot:CAMPEP_0202962072 /NCGR_PEP_ID=MMETSP1396-20130829/6183_1 /ASSEMBLY_ACC=CAM_ASM_000872 /TAXON_ID= /ORGANISM="Pseudokeronopsis sp., Strain Brazil" /LENGTH=165 /DNA_ID=CAMNT_0049682405 /DNA_START=229 /DNA_END=726 /DNA_ORIENTATION=-
MLERDAFRNKPAEFITFFLFSAACFILAAILLGLEFMSPSLSVMMLYLWSRKNPTVMINFLEIFHFRAPFLPWFLMLLIAMLGFNPLNDLVGIAVGHLYFFLEDIVPKLHETWGVKVLRPPRPLVLLCDKLNIHGFNLNEQDFLFEEEDILPEQEQEPLPNENFL